MLVKWPLRAKLFVGLGLLLAMVAILSSSGLYSAYAYRTLVKTLSWRVSELPLAAEMGAHVADMRVTLTEVRGTAPPRTPRDVRQKSICLGSRQHGGSFAASSMPWTTRLANIPACLEEKHKAAGSMATTSPNARPSSGSRSCLSRFGETASDDNWMHNEASSMNSTGK